MHFSFPGSPNVPYVAALSTGLRPGIPLQDGTGRVVHLDVTSPLFRLSFGGIPGITTGFAGTLDAAGRAVGTIAIPPGFPAGIRLLASAVALNPSLPSHVDSANTWGLTTN